jgi:hypothetical protein
MTLFNGHTHNWWRSETSNPVSRQLIEVTNTPGKFTMAYSLDTLETVSLTTMADYPVFSASTLDAEVLEEMDAYDALWDSAFANSQDDLDRMADEIKAKYLAGQTEDFDPDTDPDLQ